MFETDFFVLQTLYGKVLFLDEPTSGLDVLSARKIRRLILDLKKNGVTILLTTHNVEEAGELCGSIAIINGGQIVETGSPDDLRIKSRLYTYISVKFDRPIDPEDAEQFFKDWEYRVQGSRIPLICKKSADPIVRVVEYAKVRDLSIIEIHMSPPNLEDVFVSGVLVPLTQVDLSNSCSITINISYRSFEAALYRQAFFQESVDVATMFVFTIMFTVGALKLRKNVINKAAEKMRTSCIGSIERVAHA